MIASFRDKRTREFAEGKPVKAFSGFSRLAEMKLDQLEAATTIRDLENFLGNRLESLNGDRKGRCSIRINNEWRIRFEWPGRSPGLRPGPISVEIVKHQ